MSYINPPPVISSLQNMIAASTTWATTMGASAGQIHYPVLDIQAATLPACELFALDRDRTAYAQGARGLATGSLRIVIHQDTDAGTLEANAEALLDDLCAQSSGLAITGGKVGAASDPTPGAIAVQREISAPVVRYRSIQIDLTYGLHV